MAKDFDIGQVQPMQGGTYQGMDANITNPGKSNSMDQLVHAVGTFSEGVRKYAVTEQIDISHEQTQQVLANLNEAEAKSRNSAADLVRNGQLALGANPWAAKAARRMFMQGIAKRTGDEIAQEYESSPVRNLSPEEVANWTREQYAKKSKAMGFNDPHDIEYLDGFMPVQEQMVDKLVGYHTQVAAKRTERDLYEGIAQNASDVASANLALPDVAAKDVAENTLRTALMTGMAPRDAYESVLDGLISKAMAEQDTGFLDVAELVPTLNDRGESVAMGTRVWAQEKINDARGRLEAEKAQANKAAANNQKMVLEQNKDAILGEAGEILFSGKAPLPATVQQYETVIQKAQQLVAKGILDPEVPAKLRKMREDEVEANLKASERGERIGDYGAQAHQEAAQLILRGQVKNLSQVTEMYSSPALRPFLKDGYKAFNGYTKAQEVEANSGIQGLRMGFLTSEEFKSLSSTNPVAARNAELYMNSAIIDYKAKNPDASALDMSEAYGKILGRVREDFMGEGKADSPNKTKVLTYGEQLRTQIDAVKNVDTQAKVYNSKVVDKIDSQMASLRGVPKMLEDKGISKTGSVAKSVYIHHAKKIRGLAEASGDPDAIESSKAVNKFLVAKFSFDEEKPMGQLHPSEFIDFKDQKRYMRVPELDAGSMQLLLDSKVVKPIAGYTGQEEFVFTDPDKAFAVLTDYTVQQIKATRRDVKPDPVK